MEPYQVSRTESGPQTDGFPDVIKVISLVGPRARRLADLALHKSDLQFADECFLVINSVPEQPPAVREALWRSAIGHVFKCFGDSGVRFQIFADKVLKGEVPEAILAFNYFKSLRNKHMVHDENSYSQSLPGAILNNGAKTYKVEKIVCFATNAVTDTHRLVRVWLRGAIVSDTVQGIRRTQAVRASASFAWDPRTMMRSHRRGQFL